MDDPDLRQLRAFVAVAEQRHFGRAAEQLAISQQAASKRIAALEGELGVRLLDRGPAYVRLTDAGQRLLAPARAALAAGRAAVAAVRQQAAPARLDVWGHLFEPLRTVREVLSGISGLTVEVGAARDLDAVAAALSRGESAAGFGRHQPGSGRELAHRLVRLEPVDAVLPAAHPLARADRLRPADLAALRLVLPAAPARLDFLARFGERFGVPLLPGDANLGLAHLLDRVRALPDGCTLLPAELPLAVPPGLVVRPLADPVPLYAWSLVWHRERPHPAVPALLRAFAERGRDRRWLEYRPGRDWLPGADADELA
ncbi:MULTISPECIES: LysR family transcriptional regulator [Kitasatospora]|uniref:Putative LysR family transcriptional regulator n=1 Tax=Kitasatospora setae (strain ATCC 33774 / DSM 43861 / JCM 3304 / KCC A-0304 / NBRC 14216 / KM-6054) TaxID=452652 RepID=E4NBM5_KITSK|nr:MULTISPECIES: LysR family transcriptional regulator [Kitasatospora]BAJ28606.1 putative LysR family transcriptional regulator [Kitasatospora setae KM-6054]